MVGKFIGIALALSAAVGSLGCEEWSKAQARREAERKVPVVEALTQSYAAPNGLITAHYPADFAAKVVGKSSLMLTRIEPDGQPELITLMSTDNPISNDTREFARVLNESEKSELTGYREASNAPKVCNGQAAVEITASWKPDEPLRNFRRSCTFIRNGRGYSFAYTLPEELGAPHRALLETIVEGTTFDR